MIESFTVYTEKGDHCWVAQLKEHPAVITQARYLDGLDEMIRDALSLFPDLADDACDAGIDLAFTTAPDLIDRSCNARAAGDNALRQIARELSARGYATRDIAYLLGISTTHACHLTSDTPPAPSVR
ncbi:hypothetical protein QP905_11155 [Corynebacterium pseudodiphtheriticum]|uniref:hypothetical protein n=1 Tax=Corynebacterium pseudodiphtheriticum TaxID=37637 RepID=UPI002550A2B7|nr:hypothetical protein [Corynebacterium pseudodiphtheriticum]MDK8578895.1 hypothetical protein [Corynebacterium pseudodiphtheriticum]MDK8701200.1 hypothetical protein [Corynebacterium pseudodiphtheriticum]MDK8775852.1 hypothetical protein [Corynebacterium pseudodiphtheriticum]